MISEFPSIRAQRGPGRRPDESHAAQGEDSRAAYERFEVVQCGEEHTSLLLQGWGPLPARTWPVPHQPAPPGSPLGTLNPTSTGTAGTHPLCRAPLDGLRQELPHLWAPLQAPHPMRTGGSGSVPLPQRVPPMPCRSLVHHLMAQEQVMSLVLHLHSYGF